jgi:hypothetical protein
VEIEIEELVNEFVEGSGGVGLALRERGVRKRNQ